MMSDLYWLTDEQMARLQPYFPKSHGRARVDDRRVLSGIIFVNRNGLRRSEEHTSELQSLMRSSYAVFCLKKKIMELNKVNHNNRHVVYNRNIIHNSLDDVIMSKSAG